MAIPVITPLPPYPATPPNRTQPSSEFNENMADAFSYMAAAPDSFNTWAGQLTDIAEYIDGAAAEYIGEAETLLASTTTQNSQSKVNAAAALGHAQQALTNANLSITYRDQAAAIANYGGEWSSRTGAATRPLSVSHLGLFWILKNNLVAITSSEPGIDDDWLLSPADSRTQYLASFFKRATWDLDFARNSHQVYEQYGLEPKQLNRVAECIRSTTENYSSPFGISTAAINDFVIRTDPLTGERQGLVVSPASTNLLLRSAEFNDSSWGKARSTVTSNAALSPDNTTTADLVAHNIADTSDWYVGQTGSVTTGVTYCSSVYFKPSAGATSSMAAYLSGTGFSGTNIAVAWDRAADAAVVISGSPVKFGMEKRADGWRRIWVTAVATTTGSIANLGLYWARNGTIGTYTATADPVGEGYYLWNAQVEAGFIPSSSIPTTTAQVTRGAAQVRDDLLTNFNQSAGAFYVEFFASGAGNLERVFAIGDTTTTNECAINNGSGTSASKVVATIRAGGVNSLLTPPNTVTTGQKCKAMLRYVRLFDGTYDWQYAINGGGLSNSGAAVNTPTLPTGFAKAAIGCRHYNSATLQYGYPISRTVYIPGVVSDSEMLTVTS